MSRDGRDDRFEALLGSPVRTSRDLVRRAIAASTLRLVRAEPVVRADDDPEGVHQARVAVRRLRSDLRTFGSLLDGEATASLRAELAWLGGVLGPVRDADVLGARLRRRLRRASGSELTPAKVLLDELEIDRIEAFRRLIQALGSARYHDVVGTLESAASMWPITNGDRAARRAGELLDAPWSVLRRRARRLGPASSDASIHAVRIRAKRMRYGAEAFTPVFGTRAARFASATEQLQKILGEHQDAVVAASWLTERAPTTEDAAVAFAAGRLAEQELAAQEQARARWPSAWKALRARKPFWS